MFFPCLKSLDFHLNPLFYLLSCFSTLVSLHKRTLTAIFLSTSTLAILDYNFVSILPPKNDLTRELGVDAQKYAKNTH